MRRLIFILLALQGLWAAAQGEPEWDPRNPHYYYTNSEWFDGTPCYPDNLYIWSSFGFGGDDGDSNYIVMSYHHTDTPLTLYGLAGLFTQTAAYFPPVCATSFVLYRYDSVQGQFRLIDSARWDTAALRFTHIHAPNNHAPDGDHMPVYFREAYFKAPVTVCGDFWVGGNSHYDFPYYAAVETSQHLHTSGYGDPYSDTCKPQHPAFYFYHRGVWKSLYDSYANDPYNAWYDIDYFSSFFGIVGEVTVTALTSDSAKGTVAGGGLYGLGSRVTLRALPDSLHRFSHWQDGNAENPRVVTVTHDTTFVAYFDTARYRKLNVYVNDSTLGHATGGGLYPERSRVRIGAVADTGCSFVTWTDGIRDNPRTVTVGSDTAFFALLQRNSPVGLGAAQGAAAWARVRPNPTDGQATLETAAPMAWAELYDGAGRLVWRKEGGGLLAMPLDLGALPSGAYLLRVRTAQGTATLKVALQ